MLKKSEKGKKCHRKKCHSCTNAQMNIKIDKMRKKCLNIKSVKYFLNILLYS